jgi:hypothetical protein
MTSFPEYSALQKDLYVHFQISSSYILQVIIYLRLVIPVASNGS